jgi:hypothetical protein
MEKHYKHSLDCIHALISKVAGALMCVVLVIINSFCFAQAAGIKGKVLDEHGQSLIGAHIQILDPDGKSTGRGAATDIDGNYVLQNLQIGLFNLQFSGIGLDIKVIKGVPVFADSITTVDAKLHPRSSFNTGCILTQYKIPLINKSDTKIEQIFTKYEIGNMGF